MADKLQQGDRLPAISLEPDRRPNAGSAGRDVLTLPGAAVLPRRLVTLLRAAVGRMAGEQRCPGRDGRCNRRRQCGTQGTGAGDGNQGRRSSFHWHTELLPPTPNYSDRGGRITTTATSSPPSSCWDAAAPCWARCTPAAPWDASAPMKPCISLRAGNGAGKGGSFCLNGRGWGEGEVVGSVPGLPSPQPFSHKGRGVLNGCPRF